jgi:glycosyltransferase involved in cell wall biosynthesis
MEGIAAQMALLPQESPWREVEGHPYFLYLSRLHPKKRLDLLIRSWAKLASDFPDWRLVIAGAGEQMYIDECRQITDQLGISEKCLWLGHVNELQKSWLFVHAHCYVLPSYSENFGNTVAEALAHKTPVITTCYTPWAELPKHQCGWLIDNSEDQLLYALEEAMNISPAIRLAMGNNGAALVRSRYSLELVSKDILEVYEWLLNGRTKPDCVIE